MHACGTIVFRILSYPKFWYVTFLYNEKLGSWRVEFCSGMCLQKSAHGAYGMSMCALQRDPQMQEKNGLGFQGWGPSYCENKNE